MPVPSSGHGPDYYTQTTRWAEDQVEIARAQEELSTKQIRSLLEATVENTEQIKCLKGDIKQIRAGCDENSRSIRELSELIHSLKQDVLEDRRREQASSSLRTVIDRLEAQVSSLASEQAGLKSYFASKTAVDSVERESLKVAEGLMEAKAHLSKLQDDLSKMHSFNSGLDNLRSAIDATSSNQKRDMESLRRIIDVMQKELRSEILEIRSLSARRDIPKNLLESLRLSQENMKKTSEACIKACIDRNYQSTVCMENIITNFEVLQ